MTKADVCQLLGISERTLQRKMRSGAVSFTKVGGRVEFSRPDLGLPETDGLAVDLSHDLPKGDPLVLPETAAVPVPAALPAVPVLPVTQEPTESLPDAATFKDSMGNKLGDPNPVSLLGSGFATDPESAFIRNRDARTTISHERIEYRHGNARVPSGFKENLGYGTTAEGLQAEIDFYRRYPRASLKRFGPR